eukprot:15446815-Alexandrium_andersonii.AAC.1
MHPSTASGASFGTRLGTRCSSFEHLKQFEHLELALVIRAIESWGIARQEPRIARIADWRIADWSPRFGGFGPLQAPL